MRLVGRVHLDVDRRSRARRPRRRPRDGGVGAARDIEKHVIGEALWWSYIDDGPGAATRWVKYPITRVTANRVYYMYGGRETYTDRARLVARGRCDPPGGGAGCSLSLEGP